MFAAASEGAGPWAGAPGQGRQLSLLAQALWDETTSSADLLQIRQLWPYPNAQLGFHGASLILSLFVFPFKHLQVKHCAFPTVHELLGPAKGHLFHSALF